jgi:cell division protein FtsQ
MAARKRAAIRTKPTPRKGRSASPKRGKGKHSTRGLLPAALSVCLIFCIAVIAYMGFQTAAASEFFKAERIYVSGTKRSSRESVERVVTSQTEQSGVWNADLAEIKSRVERLPFVRSAAVSRILPSGIAVEVFEHVPAARVATRTGELLVDEQARVLAESTETEPDLPFALLGWNEAKSEVADKENLERVKLYQQMLTAWTDQDLANDVRKVDLSDVRDPRVLVEDSGMEVRIAVGREKFGENLSRGIRAIVGKGDTFEGVDLVGRNLILAPRRAASDR